MFFGQSSPGLAGGPGGIRNKDSGKATKQETAKNEKITHKRKIGTFVDFVHQQLVYRCVSHRDALPSHQAWRRSHPRRRTPVEMASHNDQNHLQQWRSILLIVFLHHLKIEIFVLINYALLFAHKKHGLHLNFANMMVQHLTVV